MKAHTYLLIICLLACSSILCSQQHVRLHAVDRPAFEVFRQVEQQSSLKIYCIPSEMDSLILSVNYTGDSPVTALEEAFKGTTFKVYPYEDTYIFIIKEKSMQLAIADNFYFRATTPRSREELAGLLSIGAIEQKATSENKVYTIGDESQATTAGRVQLTGTITDFRSGEAVVGAVIHIENTRYAATTDAFGFYSLQLPAGRQLLHIKGVGLKETQRQVMLYTSGKLDIELEEQIYSLTEVTVLSEKLARIQSTALGVERIQIKEIKNIPTAFGELDVIRVVMMLPGVKTVGEASSGFNVRGGSTDQNLILFNDGTIYNPTHLFGFFSAFNPDLVKDIELYKSSIPVKYGGRISSVLDINGRTGNKKAFAGSFSLGLLTSRMTLEGPIGKKTSFIAGGRTTYSDWILGLLPDDSEYRDGKAGFYDLNMIIDHKFSDKDNLYLSGYYSHDRFNLDQYDHYRYTNANASAKWRHIFNNKLTGTFTGGYDHYDYKTTSTSYPVEAFDLRFGINQFFGKLDFTSYFNESHTLDFGAGTIFYDLNAGEIKPYADESLLLPDKVQGEKAVESSIYLADRWDIISDLSVNAGIRFTLFNAMGPRRFNEYEADELPDETNISGLKEITDWKSFQTYQHPEFRFSMRYAFSSDFSVKAGVNTLNQYIHKISNTTVMSPTDTWKLSDANIKPQHGMQVAAGMYKNFLNNTIETSIEGYYKTMNDYLDYRSGAILSMNHHIETEVINTRGKAYGIEFLVKKTQGKLNGWASYTYSRAQLQQNDQRVKKPINNGNWYPADFDKPHEFKFIGNYKFTQRYSVSLNCDYSTGRPITLPTSKYEYVDGEFAFYSNRNQYRIPDFFRLDLAFNIEPSHHLTLLTHSSISFGVYNLTGQKNAYSVYYTAEKGALKGYKLAIFGAPIPYVAYNIKF